MFFGLCLSSEYRFVFTPRLTLDVRLRHQQTLRYLVAEDNKLNEQSLHCAAPPYRKSAMPYGSKTLYKRRGVTSDID